MVGSARDRSPPGGRENFGLPRKVAPRQRRRRLLRDTMHNMERRRLIMDQIRPPEANRLEHLRRSPEPSKHAGSILSMVDVEALSPRRKVKTTTAPFPSYPAATLVP